MKKNIKSSQAIKEKMWGEIVENIERLYDWFELHQSFQAICGSMKEHVQKNNDLFKLENTA